MSAFTSIVAHTTSFLHTAATPCSACTTHACMRMCVPPHLAGGTCGPVSVLLAGRSATAAAAASAVTHMARFSRTAARTGAVAGQAWASAEYMGSATMLKKPVEGLGFRV